MNMKFASYLQKIRSEKKLTQQSLLELLVESDNAFSKLDLTTLSRWERGVTTPKLEKQVLIARLMNDDIAPLLDPDVNITKTKKNSLDKVINKTLNPYSSNNSSFRLIKLNSLKEEPVLSEKLQTFHKDYLGIDIQDGVFTNQPIHADLYINDEGELIGHLLYGYVPINSSTDSLDINSLNNCNFIKRQPEEDAMLYIISSYSSLSKPRSMILLSILDLLRRNTFIGTACINCHDEDGFNLYEKNSAIDIIRKGSEIDFGGIKIFGKRYRYIQILVNSESILASKIVSDLIPFTCQYIEDLLTNN